MRRTRASRLSIHSHTVLEDSTHTPFFNVGVAGAADDGGCAAKWVAVVVGGGQCVSRCACVCVVCRHEPAGHAREIPWRPRGTPRRRSSPSREDCRDQIQVIYSSAVDFFAHLGSMSLARGLGAGRSHAVRRGVLSSRRCQHKHQCTVSSSSTCAHAMCAHEQLLRSRSDVGSTTEQLRVLEER